MSAARTQDSQTDPSFRAEYLLFDRGDGHMTVNERTPVYLDGFRWCAPVLDGDVRARGVVTEIEADDDGYIIHVEPNLSAVPLRQNRRGPNHG